MKKEILLFGLILSICMTTFAQKGKDYILTLRKDTLFGKIKTSANSENIAFIFKHKKIIFHPSTIKSYGVFKKGEYLNYKSIKLASGKWLFVQILNEGKIKLYKYRRYSSTSKSTKLKNLYYIGHSDERLVAIAPNTYERTMKAIVKNNPTLIAQIDQSSFEDVPKIIGSINRL